MAEIEFGLMLQPKPEEHFPGPDLIQLNRQMIELLSGFSSLWVEDHLQWDAGETMECLTTLSFLAAEYPRYQVGTMVLGQLYRNPALLAKMAANLQWLTNGRLVLGIGGGWKEDEYLAYGYGEQLPDVRTRMEQLEETARILRAMWSELPANFEGKHYQVRNAYCSPLPNPPIPLLIGGGGEKRTLGIVARYADWYNFNSCPVEVYAHKVQVLKEHCRQIGRDPNEIQLSYLGTVSVSENPEEVEHSSEKHFIAGNAAEVIQEIRQFHEVGVKTFIFRFPDPATVQRFVDTVVPAFVKIA